MLRTVVSTALFVVLASGAGAGEARPVACKANPAVVGACFIVHGTMSARNGAPTFGIWNKATRRMLGVRSDQDGLPSSLIPILMRPNGNAFGKLFDGDYMVCPLTRERPGRMQMVCVEEATNVKVRWIER